MSEFNPGPRDRLVIGGQVFQVMPHPAVPTFAFGQEGRKAFVYQVAASVGGGLYALKKFKPAYRVAELVDVCDALARFAGWPGLEVCDRQCLHRGAHDDALDRYPDLEYAVLMPWITGSTWYDIVIATTSLSRLESLTFANAMAQVLSALEEAGLAHCDIAAPNVIINGATGQAHLIDVEDLYSPSFNPPGALPAGTDGYAHKTASAGLWGPSADRFAGAVIMAEMVAWHSPEIRRAADEEHFFSVDEMQQDSPRYRLMRRTLAETDPLLAELFDQAWFSETLDDCPRLKDWYEVINQAYNKERLSKVVADWQPISISGPLPDAAPRPFVPPEPAPASEPPFAAPEPTVTASQPSGLPRPIESVPPPQIGTWTGPSRPITPPAQSAPMAPPASSAPRTILPAPPSAGGGPVTEWRPLIVPQTPPPPAFIPIPLEPEASSAVPEAEPAAVPIPPAPEPEPVISTTPLVPESEAGGQEAGREEGAYPQADSLLEQVALREAPLEEAPAEEYTSVEPPAAPASLLLKPVLGLSHVDDRNRPHLAWTESPGAKYYLVQEASNPSFNSAKEFKVKAGETLWHPLWGRSGRLYYRVRAVADGEEGPWSDTLSLRIGKI
jgi:hypothetical protein